MRTQVRVPGLHDVCIFCSARIQLISTGPTSRAQRRFLRSSNARFKPPETAAIPQTEAPSGPIYGQVPKQTPSFGGGWGKPSFSVKLTPEEAALRDKIQKSKISEPTSKQEPQVSHNGPRPPARPGRTPSFQTALKKHPPASYSNSRSLSLQWECMKCKSTNERDRPNCVRCNLMREKPGLQWRCSSCGWHNERSRNRCSECNSFSVDDVQISEMSKQGKHVRRYGRDQQSVPESDSKLEAGKLDMQSSGERPRKIYDLEAERLRWLEKTSRNLVGFRAAASKNAQPQRARNERPQNDRPLARRVLQTSSQPTENGRPYPRFGVQQQQKEQGRKVEVSRSPGYTQYIPDDTQPNSPRLESSPHSSQGVRSGWTSYRPAASQVNGEEKSQRLDSSTSSDLPLAISNGQYGVNPSAETDELEASSSDASLSSLKDISQPSPETTLSRQDVTEGNMADPQRASRIPRNDPGTASSRISDLRDAGYRDISWYEATSRTPLYRSVDLSSPGQATRSSQDAPKTANYAPEDIRESGSSRTFGRNAGDTDNGVRFTSDERLQPEVNDTYRGYRVPQNTSQLTRSTYTGTESTNRSDRYAYNERRAYPRDGPRDSKNNRHIIDAAPYVYRENSRKPRYVKDEYEEENYEDDEDREEARRKRKQQRKKERAAQKQTLPPTPIYLPEFISVGNLARVLHVRVEDFTRKMKTLGFEETNNDHVIDAEVAGLIAAEFNFDPIVDKSGENQDLRARPQIEDRSLLPPRPPIVTIMGHVDHGKTTLLDYLRKSSVAASEHGGITQHIGAFSVSMPGGRLITFLDTPGHAAFLSMRQRGANVTDIVILVVAADDSVKPQTVEAIKHAQAAKVPMIVAINKVDKEDKNIDRVKQDLARYGVEIEDFGGDTQVVCVSGKTGQGLNELEENVVAQADILDMRAETDGQAEGWVLEGATKRAGRVATVLVRRGTIRQGDIIVAGTTWAKIRTLKNEAGVQVPHAGPGTPVEVDGWKDQPIAGDEVLQAISEQQAKSAIDYRLEQAEKEQMTADMSAVNESRRLEQERREAAAKAPPTSPAVKSDDTEPPGAQSPASATGDVQSTASPQTTGPPTLPIILKADVSGSVEACLNAITGLGTSIISPLILRSTVGPISEGDISYAAISGAEIVSFNQTTAAEMYKMAEREGVHVVEENVIYRLTDLVKRRMEDLLPEKVEIRVVGEAEIAKPFEIGIGGRKKLLVAGCRVRNGVVSRSNKVRVLRGGEGGQCVFDGMLSSLKNVKKDVTEMRKGGECGMAFEGWEGFKEGDMVQCYEEKRSKQTL